MMAQCGCSYCYCRMVCPDGYDVCSLCKVGLHTKVRPLANPLPAPKIGVDSELQLELQLPIELDSELVSEGKTR